MAFISKVICVILFLLLCLVVMEQASDCGTGYGCFYALATTQEVQNRKLLAGFEAKKEGVKGGTVHLPGSSSSIGNVGNLEGWELRKVPSGPDPLHHNGGGPKKPQTP